MYRQKPQFRSPRIGGESPYLGKHLPVDYYALTSGKIIIVIAARKGTRPFPIDVTQLMHPRNCFASRHESDSTIGPDSTRSFRIELKGCETIHATSTRSLRTSVTYRSDTVNQASGKSSGKREATDHDSTLKGMFALPGAVNGENRRVLSCLRARYAAIPCLAMDGSKCENSEYRGRRTGKGDYP